MNVLFAAAGIGGKSCADRLAADHIVQTLPPAADGRAAFLRAHGGDIAAFVTTGHHGADAALMDALPSLKVISCFGVGYDGIDVAAATARGIWVGNTPDVLNDDVADMALALMLATARRLPAADRHVRDGRWEKGENYPLTARLSERRLGIIGLGRIGNAIARRACAFGMPVAYHNRRPVAASPYRYVASLRALAAESDFLCLTVPLTAETEKLVDADVLQALGADGFFINISRGGAVDEEALVRALENGVIAGAGLDVFADEPRVPAALKKMEHVVLSPHQGSATHHTRQRMAALTCQNVNAVLDGGTPRAAVNRL